MNSIQETTAWTGRNRYGAPFSALDFKRQITVILDRFGESHLHRAKAVGVMTKKARAYVTYQVFDDIRLAGYALKSVLNLDQRHICAVAEKWRQQQLSASTIQGRLSILKWFSIAIGKRGLIREPAFYGFEADDVARTYVAEHDKSWTGNNVIPAEMIVKAYELDQWVGCQLELMKEFGLRVTEATLLRPRASDTGAALVVELGTKGGRTRIVKIRTDAQRQLLERAKVLALSGSRGSMIPASKTPAQARNRLYYICRKLGLTKDQLAVTPHGLRHQYANDLYEEVSGVPSAVRGGSAILDRAADQLARQEVTRDLGHARESITAAYTGPRKPGRPPVSALRTDVSGDGSSE
ncbi:tyrosine-type recombinase/integrase [Roseateles violae]|uniref:Integrase domain-containing protein n=1 Tax=Roseateles violae TaxID=3058042 RepID=A0ABT8DUH8_9BURK|nr:integrase domain-containing protein [Pelomonas sp. PFR6]MDN3920042.1 integrase domain-containing protein [Pelomonas sp. PFR6]